MGETEKEDNRVSEYFRLRLHASHFSLFLLACSVSFNINLARNIWRKGFVLGNEGHNNIFFQILKKTFLLKEVIFENSIDFSKTEKN